MTLPALVFAIIVLALMAVSIIAVIRSKKS